MFQNLYMKVAFSSFEKICRNKSNLVYTSEIDVRAVFLKIHK